MKNQSLVDLFDEYDKAFDEVCEELHVLETPTWQQRWFYRYYQINLLPQITYLLYHNSEAFQFQELFGTHKNRYESESIYETNQKFYSTFSESFPNWWFKRAKNYFANRKDKVKPIIAIKFDDEFEEKSFITKLKYCAHDIKSTYRQKFRPTHLLLSVPVRNSKKETIEIIEKYLDQTIYFSNFQRHYGRYSEHNPYNLPKNKIPLKTIKDCFRLLEYMVENPEDDLVTIAQNSGALEFSRANLNSSRSAESINSIRVGTNRLIKVATELLHSNAYGFFPETRKIAEYESYILKVKDIFPLLTSKNLFDSAKVFLPKKDKMVSSIRSDMLKLKSDGFLD